LKLEVPLERYREKVLPLIARLAAEGRGWSEIAEAVSREVGFHVGEEMVKYFYSKYLAPATGEDEVEEVDVGSIRDELRWLYSVQKSRILRLQRLEREAGLPIPETARNIEVALKILELMQKSESGVDVESVLKRMVELVEG